MATNFPDTTPPALNPDTGLEWAAGDTFDDTAESGLVYVWSPPVWKTSVEAIPETDGRYVNVSGDNMEGNLTLGPDGGPAEITINATDGSISSLGGAQFTGAVAVNDNINHPDEAALNISGANGAQFIQLYDRVNTTDNSFTYDNGFLGFDGNVNIDGTLNVSERVVGSWNVLAGRTSREDYQNMVFAPASDSEVIFNDSEILIKNGSLYIGKGYIIPEGYTGTITFFHACPDGIHAIYVDTSVDRDTWTEVYMRGGSSSGNNSYTFDGTNTQPLALRFRMYNGNGTNSFTRLNTLIIPGLNLNKILDHASGGGVVDQSAWSRFEDGTQLRGYHRYIRFNDGTQICTFMNTGDGDTMTPGIWTFPASFIWLPCVTYSNGRGITPGTGEGNCAIVPGGNQNVNATSVSLRRYVLDGYSSQIRYYGITAIGKWRDPGAP